MSRKHYVEVARLIADEIESASPLFERSRINGASNIARGLADMFAADNGHFDRQRFYFAAALDSNGRPNWKALVAALSLHERTGYNEVGLKLPTSTRWQPPKH